ncbi:MAG: AI-2E family transporter [Gammaproteobacteria bacterium]|nr:MAG: AI-2E family transporter [Gammaproteobacteria bacterium]
MHRILHQWYERYLADEEAVLLLVLLASAGLVIAFLGGIMAPLLASIVVAYLLQGAVSRLERWRVPHMLSVSLVTLAFIGFFMTVMVVVLPLISRQLAAFWAELPHWLVEGQAWLQQSAQRYRAILPEQSVQQVMQSLQQEVTRLGPKLLSLSLLRGAFEILLYLVLVPILVFFLLLDRELILAWVSGLLPARRPMLNRIASEMNVQMSNYVRGKAIEILIVASVSLVAFQWMGLRYALLLAVLVGLSVIVPYVGATVVTLPVLAVGLMQWGWSADFFWLCVVYGVIQALDGNVLVPLLFSEAVNLHPVVIIAAVLFFGGMWGLWGVFFAIPLATLVKAIINAWPKRVSAPE